MNDNEEESSSSSAADEEQRVNTAFIKHRRIDELESVWRRVGNEMSPYLVEAMLTPNFNSGPLSAAPSLQRAFDTGPAFRQRELLAGRNAFRTTFEQQLSMPRGYALKVDGAMPIDSEARVYHALGSWNAGLGTSMYIVKALPASWQSGNDQQVIASCNQDARDSLPHLISPSHRIALTRTSDPLKGTGYALFVTANDVPAARRLVTYTGTRAASADPMTLENLLTSREYEDVLVRSQLVRDHMAQQYAKAYGVELDNEGVAVHTTLTHSASPANNLAHGAHASLPIHTGRESRYYVLYNDAVDTSRVHDGQVLLNHGIMGGFTMLKNGGDLSEQKIQKSQAWVQPHALSAMPSSSVEAHETETRARAMHTEESARTREAFAARVVWHSDIGFKFPHSAARETYNAMTDPFTATWLNKLAPAQQHSADGVVPLAQQSYTLVVGQLPNISTLYATEDELARLSRHSGTPKNVPIALDHPIVSRVPALFDQVIRSAGYAGSLDSIFRNIYEQETPPGSFGRLYESSALDEPEFDDTLYADAEDFGLSTCTGVPLSAAAHFGDTAAARMMSSEDIDTLRGQATRDGRSLSPVGRAQTVINMDTGLLRLITALKK